MSIRAVRKGLGLFLVDIFIIIGIFVLQFRTDSNILEKIGNLQISLERDEDSESGHKGYTGSNSSKNHELSEADDFGTVNVNSNDNSGNNLDIKSNVPLKNKFQVTYNGISLSSDEQNPARLIYKNQKDPVDAKLLSYSLAPLSACFNFEDNIMLLFELSNDTPDAALSVNAILPPKVASFQIPYSFAYNMNIIGTEGNRTLLDSKKQTWSFTSNMSDEGFITFSQKDSFALYSIFDNTKKFGFEDLVELASAEENVYSNNVEGFKNNLISSFKSALSENNFTEKAVIAYVAAQAEKGKYQQAIDEIPQSYKKSDQRTYLSSPFFNNLAKLHNSLEKEYTDIVSIISKAVASGNLDIFTTENFPEHLCIYPDKIGAKKILENATYADIQNSSVAQATGILKAYVVFAKINPDYAKILQPVVDGCIQKITDSCKFENNVLTISENDTFLSVIQAVETGTAILRYGELIDNEVYTKAGRVIINSYMEGSSSFDLRTLSNLYPILIYNNWYYPHTEIIKNGSSYTWAWTCAKNIKYEKDAENTLTVTIDFPEGLTHYVMLKGIPEFETIYIYNMAFRTDPRFETYNSSGYVYRGNNETLLLKSRHKTRLETVRMTKSGVAKSKPAAKPAGEKNNTTGTGIDDKYVNSSEKTTESTAAKESTSVQTTDSSSETSKNAISETSDNKNTTPTAPEVQKPEPPKTYKIVLKSVPQNTRPILSVIREFIGNNNFGEQELKNLPLVLKTNVSESESSSIIYKLTVAGGSAERQ